MDLRDSLIKVNNNIEGDISPRSILDIQVTDGVNPVTPNNIIFVDDALEIQVPAAAATTYATADVMQSGQTVSETTYDDGDTQFGRLVDFFTLAEDNKFGNANRFTDTVGGQTYANNIILDHSTYNGSQRLSWYKGNYTTNSATLANACLAAHAATYDTFATWFVPNEKQMSSILYNGGGSGVVRINYAPFNITLVDDFWTTTSTPLNPTLNVYVYQNYNYCPLVQGARSYAFGKHIPCRYITDAELGV